MDKKGIILDNYKGFYFKIRELDEIQKYAYLLNIDINHKDLKNFIKEKSIKYLIMPWSSYYMKIPLPELDIPIIIGTGDTPRRLSNDDLRKYYEGNNASAVITHNHCNVDPLKDYFGDINPDIFDYKYGMDLDIITDYGINKDIDVLTTGKFSRYQYRLELHALFSHMRNINYKRIRQGNVESGVKDLYKDYAKTINKSWISIGGCLQEKHVSYYKGELISDTFPKNIEIPGCRTCLISSDWGDRRNLGFIDGINCIIFNDMKDAKYKVESYLNDKEELRKIIDRGYNLVKDNYNIVDTVGYLMDKIENKYG